MAITNRIAAQILVQGGEAHTTWTPAAEPLVVELVVTQLISSQVRVVLYNALGQVVGTEIVNGTNRRKLQLEAFDGAIGAQIICLRGSAQVRLDQLTGSDAFGGQVLTADLAAGIISADAAGRALMADDYFTAAMFAAGAGGKFAANCLVSAGIQNLFAANSMDGAACAHVFPAGAIPIAAVAAAPFSLETIMADPGNAGTLTPAGSGTCALTIGAGAETMTLAAPPGAVGYTVLICADVVGGGTRALQQTAAAAFNAAAQTTCTFNSVNDWALFGAIQVGGAPLWRLLASDGVVLA